MVKFFLLMVVISVVIRIGLSLVLPPHWAAVGQLMGTLAFGLCILLSPLRPRYFQYPSVRDQEKVPQDNEQLHGELYFVGSDNRSLPRKKIRRQGADTNGLGTNCPTRRNNI